jgi:hypothetical protein
MYPLSANDIFHTVLHVQHVRSYGVKCPSALFSKGKEKIHNTALMVGGPGVYRNECTYSWVAGGAATKGKLPKTTWQLLTVSKLCLASFCLVFGKILATLLVQFFVSYISAHLQSYPLHISSFSSFRGVEPGTVVWDCAWCSCPVSLIPDELTHNIHTCRYFSHPWDRKINMYFWQNNNNDILNINFFPTHSGVPSADTCLKVHKHENFLGSDLEFCTFL